LAYQEVLTFTITIAARRQTGKCMQVFVRDNNVDQALKILKRKMQREGVFREIKQHAAYEKPSERKIREKAEAIRRARKLTRKKLQREGLLPMPKAKPRLRARSNIFHADRSLLSQPQPTPVMTTS
jgi:small subunit ribosomal protein S21